MADIIARMSRRRADRVGGFTLVELLIVIGIIALLIAILLPAISSARSQATLLKCVSNVRAIMQGVQAYMAENHGCSPRGHTYEFAFQISGYLGGPMCGVDEIRHWERDPAWGNENVLKEVQVYTCPARPLNWYLGYVINNVDFDYYRATGQYIPPDFLAGVPNSGHQFYKTFPPDAAYVVELNGGYPYYVNGRDISNLGICHPALMTFDELGQPNDKPIMIRSTDKRHRGRTAIGFFDGHAESRLIAPGDLPVSLLNPYQK